MEDVYEAIVRFACMKALPTDAEIEASGCCDGGDFLLRLREKQVAKCLRHTQ